MARAVWPAALLLLAIGAVALPAQAQAGAGLPQAEQAYAEVDFEKTRSLARAAIERGKNDRASTARLYLLWAISSAALDQGEEARGAFAHALAADPALRLDKSLSPKIRAPYLEARGSLSVEDGKPGLQLTLQRVGAQLELRLRDTARVARGIELHSRARNAAEPTRQRFEPKDSRRIPVPAGGELELYVQVLDANDNVLFELGTRDEPRRLAPETGGRTPLGTVVTPSGNPTPYYATAGVLGALGIASGAAATVMFTRREDAAREWNGPECEKPGTTRGEQCASVDERRARAEYLTIGLASASAGLLIGGVVSLLLAPSRAPAKARFALEATPERVSLGWQTAL